MLRACQYSEVPAAQPCLLRLQRSACPSSELEQQRRAPAQGGRAVAGRMGRGERWRAPAPALPAAKAAPAAHRAHALSFACQAGCGLVSPGGLLFCRAPLLHCGAVLDCMPRPHTLPRLKHGACGSTAVAHMRGHLKVRFITTHGKLAPCLREGRDQPVLAFAQQSTGKACRGAHLWEMSDHAVSSRHTCAM